MSARIAAISMDVEIHHSPAIAAMRGQRVRVWRYSAKVYEIIPSPDPDLRQFEFVREVFGWAATRSGALRAIARKSRKAVAR